MSLSKRPTRPFGHSDLPALPPSPAASPRLRRAAGKEGRLAPPTPPPLPAAAPRASPDRNVLMYLRTGSAGSTGTASGPAAWAQASFARRSPSREVRNPSRVLQCIVDGRRRALLAEARRGRCGTLPGFCSVSSMGAGELCSPKPVAGGAEPFQGSAVYRRWAQASFARRSPSREVRNPSRVLQRIVGRSRLGGLRQRLARSAASP
jgi:hypothetical protein